MRSHDFMKQALELAKENERTKHGAPFGAIVVKMDRLLALV